MILVSWFILVHYQLETFEGMRSGSEHCSFLGDFVNVGELSYGRLNARGFIQWNFMENAPKGDKLATKSGF